MVKVVPKLQKRRGTATCTPYREVSTIKTQLFEVNDHSIKTFRSK